MKTTNIQGFNVELETTHDGYVCGWVSKGRHSASIEALRLLGALDNSDGTDVQVPVRIRAEIYNWAIANGY